MYYLCGKFALMHLKAYLADSFGKVSRNSRKCTRLATAVGASPYTLYMIALGHKRAGPELAIAIEKATKGEVNRADLRSDLWSAAA